LNKPNCDELDYIHILIAAQKKLSNSEAARSHPQAEKIGPANNIYIHLMYCIQSDGEALWTEVRTFVALDRGILIIDDCNLNKSLRV
jgi:putative transposase